MHSMNTTTRSFLALTKASMKMYYRNKGALMFTLLIPVALLSIFGFLSKGGGSQSVKIALTNYSSSSVSEELVNSFKEINGFRIQETNEGEARLELAKGNFDLVVVIPENFGTSVGEKLSPSAIQTYFNESRPGAGQIANMAIVQIVSKLDKQVTQAPTLFSVTSKGEESSGLGYFDFILPGILSMSIMQLGIFGVAFSFVALKANGALRRIQATPVHPVYFVFAQAVVRLIVTLATALLLVAFGSSFFDFSMHGNYVAFFFVCTIGILIFLGFGFAIAGWARDETQAAPIANLIQLPLLLLSGIFFPRDGFPSWLKGITDFFPLTYVSHALRKIANEGATLLEVHTDLIGMFVWLAVVYAVAVKVFRWE